MRAATSAFLISALCGLALSACIPQPPDSHWTARDWASIGDKHPADPPEVWCYQTIGKPDCYTERLPSQDYRLIEGGPVANPKNMSAAPPPAEPQASEPKLAAKPEASLVD